MAKIFKKHIHIFIAIILFLCGFIVDKNQSNITGNDINIDEFEQVLHKKENEYIGIMDSVVNVLTDHTFDINNSNRPLFSPDELNELKQKGYSILIYRNDSLIFWTDNLFQVDKIFNSNQFNDDHCSFVDDYWLDYRIKKVRNYTIIGAFRIKSKYNIQNKYLQNNFHKDLNLPNSFKISLIPLSYGIDVKSNDDEYLLSLIPDNNVFINFTLDPFVGIMYFLSFFFLLLYVNQKLIFLYKGQKPEIKVVLILLIILIIRYISLKFRLPLLIYSQSFFDSQYFASSGIFESLGDVFINLLIIIVLIFHFFKILNRNIKKTIIQKNLQFLSIFTSILGTFIFMYGFKFINSFVINSNYPLNIFNVLDLNWYSLLGFVNLTLSLALIFYTLFKTFEFVQKINNSKKYFIYLLVGFLVSLFFNYLIINSINIFTLLITISTLIIISFYTLKQKTSSPYFYGIITFLSALSLTVLLITALNEKNKQNFKTIVMQLTNANDDVAELLLNDITPQLSEDQTLQTYSENLDLPDLENEIVKYLRRRYFKTYWNKYDIKVEVCSDKINDNLKTISSCNYKYSEMINSFGTDLKYSNSKFLSFSNGKTAYLIHQTFYSPEDTCVFYIFLSQKLYPANIGYPELLLDEKTEIKNIPDYSYAKYENNKITLKSGNYNYPLDGKIKFAVNTNQNPVLIKDQKHNHIVYNLTNDDYIVLTYKKITFLNTVTTFSYIYLTYIILVVGFLLIINFKHIIKIKNLNFRTKLILSMLGVLTISFTLVATVTVVLNKNQFYNSHQQEVIQKLQQINISLKQIYSNNDTSFISNVEELNNTLRNLSETFGTDINLYNSKGFLIATSRPEIYKLHLVAERASSLALYEIKHNSKVQFILDEEINLLKYQSAYSQFVDGNNNLVVIVNMPYFINPDALKSEISNLIVSIVNIYVVLFVIAMIISLFISEQIISPLIILQSKFNKLELGKDYEKIDYKRKDEIGQLVTEYNLMVDKLKESINKLSKSERESAWRDMAKQIAHEIKNPLTPMKLNIQLLMRSWENQDEDFDQRIRNVSTTLINQIETLRRIAEEFSDFAKMPKPQEEVINLSEKIEEICKLYENTENIDVIPRLQNYKEAIIFADEKQISRALINLIKNAIQAIAEGVYGKIIIDLDVYADKAIVKIIDNGTGIPEDVQSKMFVPSFTTKSSGMGLGLAMVKNIIDNAKGKISFKSTVGQGTTFILEFPLHKKS